MIGRRGFHTASCALLLLCSAFAGESRGLEPLADPNTTDAATEARVDALLRQMTLAEKLSLLGGTDGFYVPAVPRLGIPSLKMGDGPAGVRNWGNSTLYPAPVLLAAAWNPDLAQRFGVSLGRDSRARGMHISLAPGVNLYRLPTNGRNYEYLGEDPALAARIATAVIRGIQSQGVAATIKHYAANNHETRKSSISNDIDERTLRELYLRPFEAAVREAGVWAVMNAYNLLNGEYCTANDWLNNRILKGEWGFRGLLMSDWRSVHDTVGAWRGGLDLEMPEAVYFAPAKLEPLLKEAAGERELDEKLRRLLRMIVANGWLEGEQTVAAIPKDDPSSAATALEVARQGIVLLKNEAAALPLPGDGTVAVLGPNAFRTVTGLGSGHVRPFHSVSLAQGLRAAFGGSVIEVPWTFPEAVAAHSGLFRGLRMEVFDGPQEKRRLYTTATDAIAVEWTRQKPSLGIGAKDRGFVRWTGTVAAEAAGDYEIAMKGEGVNVQVWLDETRVWESGRDVAASFTFRLEAGQPRRLRVEAEQRKKDRDFRLRVGAAPMTPLVPPAMADAVRKASAAVVAVGFNVLAGEGEGHDRAYRLPGRQIELIETVAALNPRTIVVLNAGGSVDTAGWLARVPALLHAFYPGQEGGTAMAEIITGKINPSGHLPFTYERRLEDTAAFRNGPGDARSTTTHVAYREGVFLGYRWFDREKLEPLFPFGHGLSYTSFELGPLQARREGDVVQVSLPVRNTGTTAGATVIQLYVGQANAPLPRPQRELKAFARVQLQPGEFRPVQLTLHARDFSFYDVANHVWRATEDAYTIEAGFSARDIRQTTVIRYGSDPLQKRNLNRPGKVGGGSNP